MIKELLGELYTDEIKAKLEGKELVLKSDQENMIPKSRFDEVNNAKKDYQAQVEKLKGDLESASKSATDLEALKSQLADTTSEFDTYVQGVELEKVKTKKVNGVIEALKVANAMNPELLLNSFNLDDVNFDDDGKVVGVKATIENLKTQYEGQFGVKTSDSPIIKNNQADSMVWDDVLKMSTQERMDFATKDPETYKQLKP